MSYKTHALDPDHWLDRASRRCDPYRSLWAAVFLLAVRDAIGSNPRGPAYASEVVVGQARAWMNSDEADVGSFLWLCIFLDRDPERTRRAIQDQIDHPRPLPLARHPHRKYRPRRGRAQAAAGAVG